MLLIINSIPHTVLLHSNKKIKCAKAAIMEVKSNYQFSPGGWITIYISWYSVSFISELCGIMGGFSLISSKI